MFCGTPMVKNLHPDAGKLGKHVGSVYECISCKCESIHALNIQLSLMKKAFKDTVEDLLTAQGLEARAEDLNSLVDTILREI